MTVYLVSYAKCMLYSEQPTVLLAKRHLNAMILTNFENVNSLSNIFQERQDFLVLMDPVIICVYLRTTDSHFSDKGNFRLKVTKMRFGANIKYFSEPFFADFCCREGIYCLLFKKDLQKLRLQIV